MSALQKFMHPSAHAVYLRVLEELQDDRDGLTHHTRAGYKRGCRGPLCMKAMRDYGRLYQRKKFGAAKARITHKQVHDELLDLFRPKVHLEKEPQKEHA